jgi:hypothetical protein
MVEQQTHENKALCLLNNKTSGGRYLLIISLSELHQDLMRFIAQLAGVNIKRAGNSGGDSDSMSQLFKAIARGDTPTVRSMCQQDSTLVNDCFFFFLNLSFTLFFIINLSLSLFFFSFKPLSFTLQGRGVA